MTTATGHNAPSIALSCEENAGSSPDHTVWVLRGPIDNHQAPAIQRLLRRTLPPRGGRLELELSNVERIDSVGAALLVELWRRGQSGGFEVSLRGVTAEVRDFLELYPVVEELPGPTEGAGWFEALGEKTYQLRDASYELLVLAADVTIESLIGLARPWKLRWNALLEQCVYMGSQALGIVGLIMFLVGLTLAFQSAYQLRQFGAAIYVATLTAISTVREMGPLITAILVAGRSGASITSEVATMKVNEEIDAMQVMGIPFVQFVAVPKLIALVTTVPLLVLIADVLGILGGLVVAVGYLDLSTGPYLRASIDALVLKDLVTGLVKSVSFAWGIGLIGLFYGVRVRGGAQEVGQATTASVVSSIFFIIVADSLFSILFYVVL